MINDCGNLYSITPFYLFIYLFLQHEKYNHKLIEIKGLRLKLSHGDKSSPTKKLIVLELPTRASKIDINLFID
jgi:hypothetical protein